MGEIGSSCKKSEMFFNIRWDSLITVSYADFKFIKYGNPDITVPRIESSFDVFYQSVNC